MNNLDFSSKNGIGLLGLFLAIGLVISSVLLSNSIRSIKEADQAITVKGYAEKDITSDLGSWSGSINTTAGDMQTAYLNLEQNRGKVINYLLQNGISKNDIIFTAINTSKNFRLNDQGYSTNIIDSYSLYQTVSVTSKNVSLIEKIANESTALISQGVEIYSNMPQFFYTKLNDLKIEMLGEATKDAKSRALILARMSGSDVGKLKSATQGVFQITPQNSTEVSDWGEYNTTTINKTVKAVVTIEFTID